MKTESKPLADEVHATYVDLSHLRHHLDFDTNIVRLGSLQVGTSRNVPAKRSGNLKGGEAAVDHGTKWTNRTDFSLCADLIETGLPSRKIEEAKAK